MNKGTLYELDDYDHVTMADPSFHLLERHLKNMLAKKVNP